MKPSRLLDNYTNMAQDGLMLKPDHDALQYCLLGLIGEGAHLSTFIRATHHFGQPDDMNLTALAEKLGMVLWYLTNCAIRMGISLEQLAVTNIVALERQEPAKYSVTALMRGVE